MRTRVFVAVALLPILIAVLFFAPIWATGAAAGLVAVLACWEFMRCTEVDLKKRLLIYPAITAFAIPFLTGLAGGGGYTVICLFALFAAMFGELMWSFSRPQPIDFESVALALLAGGVMPVLLSAVVRLGLDGRGPIYMFLPFVADFSSDSGAYFTGLLLGRHKLAPRISPKKTIEGSIGGFVSAIAFMLLYGAILRSVGYEVDFTVMTLYGFFGSLAGQLGDLGFSAVKRLCGVKDYGTLIPGHGGMLDRFDSMFWAAPVMEFLVLCVPAIH